MTEKELLNLLKPIAEALIEKNITISVAESCTGGWLSKLLTDVSGISAIYKGGICSYANEAKMNILSVRAETLSQFGAVSAPVAEQMAIGVREALNTDIGIGITGIAGPLSDNTKKPVGLIYIAAAYNGKVIIKELRNQFTENIRENNRLSAIETAITLLGDINEQE